MLRLENIHSPADLKKCSLQELLRLADDLRNFIVEEVSKEGGHLSASLGVVELTIALHYVLDTPQDILVWDVGHQAYGHKILTGRRSLFHTNRKYKGISGFPERNESEYDPFGTGHSSTSISAVLGMAIAEKLQKIQQHQYIAVIGDGALTGGMAFEALNQAGAMDLDILVILNDNSVSIDDNVGALKDHLAELRSNKENSQGNLFHNLGFDYHGPIDGHDLEGLIGKFNELKQQKGPRLLHCITKKGKGYVPAETGNAAKWHAPGIFDAATGKVLKPPKESVSPKKYQEVFGVGLLELAKKNDRIVGITPAMPSGSSMNILMQEMPERVFDVAIAEQHAVTFSAGLAARGILPFCNIYSTFMQRGYDQLIHDVARQQLKVVFCLDRAGLVGEDGATHHGAFDLAYLRCIPNLIIAAPANAEDLWNLLYTAQLDEVKEPFVIRYPRGSSTSTTLPASFEKLAVGKGQCLKKGKEVAILTIGPLADDASLAIEALRTSHGLDIAHYDLRYLKPLDEALLEEIFTQFNRVITIEDGCINGGMGSAVLEFMNNHFYQAQLKRLGIPDEFIAHGSQEELRKACGYDCTSIQHAVLDMLDLR